MKVCVKKGQNFGGQSSSKTNFLV